MKILKPGKVEQRKFVCSKCGCEFVAGSNDVNAIREGYNKWRNICLCPTCGENIEWEDGEPYEEPVQDDRERLIALLDTNCGYTEEIPAATLADELLEHDVTFREAAMEGMEEEP